MAKGRHGGALRQIHTLFKVGAVGGLTDGELLERFTGSGGEAAELAFAALVERHGPMVLRVCRGILRDPNDAQDAFQATFLALARKANSLWVRDSLGPWLHGVAYRVASCARAATARRRAHERRAAEIAAVQPVGEEGWDDLREVIHEEVNRLPERYRVAVVLCGLEGMTHKQAAQHLGWPVGTVQSRLARGRQQLRAQLTRRGLTSAIGVLGAVVSAEGVQVAVPAALVNRTAQGALQFAAGKVSTEAVPAAVIALTKEVLRTMFLTKLKMTAATLLALGVFTAGAGVIAQQEAEPQRRAAQVIRNQGNDAEHPLPSVPPPPRGERLPSVPPPPRGEWRSLAELRQSVKRELSRGGVVHVSAQGRSGLQVDIFLDRPEHLDEAEPVLEFLRGLGWVRIKANVHAPPLRAPDSSEIFEPTDGSAEMPPVRQNDKAPSLRAPDNPEISEPTDGSVEMPPVRLHQPAEQERRLKDVERKLEEVLKALERSKREPDR